MKRPIHRLLVAGAVLAAGLLLAAGALAAWAWHTLHTPYAGHGGERLTRIERGAGAAEILRQLEAEGVLADARLARLWLVHVEGDPSLKAGEYRFAEPLTTPQVLEKLVRGDVVAHRVTIVEGLTRGETAAALADAGFGELERFLAETADPAPVRDLDPEARDLEGYLFPDTYAFARGTPEEEIVATLVGAFRRRHERWLAPVIAAGEEGPGDRAWTTRELVTLASIVEKEALLDEERPLISAVYHNRLARSIGLYADPTVIHALKLLGRWNGNLRREDLRLDHPYNTYVRPGLPPGPICSPGAASLGAAANPADVDHLYFVSRNDGTHVFARTLAEHNRNVEKWQKRYWRERWAREEEEEGE